MRTVIPANVIVSARPFFNKVAGADGEIDAFELQRVLAAVFKKDEGSVSLECARSCVAMVDRDRSGKLDYVEFRSLYRASEKRDNF